MYCAPATGGDPPGSGLVWALAVMLVTGFGMLAIQKIPFSSGWVIVKLVCWLALGSLAGVVYRKAHLRGLLSFVSLGLILVALVMVLFRPF